MNQDKRLLLNFIVAGLDAASGFQAKDENIVGHIPCLLRFVPSPE